LPVVLPVGASIDRKEPPMADTLTPHPEPQPQKINTEALQALQRSLDRRGQGGS
jgi:hypothetical protein